MQHYNELRFYAFTNFYISSIQHGIQTGHASVDLLRKYEQRLHDAQNSDNDHLKATRVSAAINDLHVVRDWADNHKTYVILNGGDWFGVNKIFDIVAEAGFPFCDFYEPGLGNIRTTVGVVLPDSIFNMRREFVRTEQNPSGFAVYRHEDTNTTIAPNDRLYKFMETYKSCGLAH